jgi:plasmid stabilization system protein ParE
MRVIVFSESALADLEGIGAWYDSQGVPDVGRRLIEEIMARIEGLTEFPETGRMVPEFNQQQLRELIHPPFRIVYRLSAAQPADEIQIIRVWRSERLLQLEQTDGLAN